MHHQSCTDRLKFNYIISGILDTNDLYKKHYLTSIICCHFQIFGKTK